MEWMVDTRCADGAEAMEDAEHHCAEHGNGAKCGACAEHMEITERVDDTES